MKAGRRNHAYNAGMSRLPTPEIMYRAFARKDALFEGVFFVAVKTTGVFCRPTCSARKPKPENVEYFASAKEAMRGGYRACLRCRPLTNQPPDLVVKLRESAASDAELESMGVDPSTARRQFQRYYGMSFHAYQRARRMGRLLEHELSARG